MSNFILNARFGARHLQIGLWFIRWEVNPYWLERTPDQWFEVLEFSPRKAVFW